MSETDKTERGNFSALSLFPIVPDRGEKRTEFKKTKTRQTEIQGQGEKKKHS